MSKAQAKLFWKALTPQQRADFNKMYNELMNQKLMLAKVNVDDNECIQNIVLDPKDKPSASDKPFYEHFHIKD